MKAMRMLTCKRGPKAELRIDPQSAKLMAARLKSPEGQALLDELARVYARAAADRLLDEQTT